MICRIIFIVLGDMACLEVIDLPRPVVLLSFIFICSLRKSINATYLINNKSPIKKFQKLVLHLSSTRENSVKERFNSRILRDHKVARPMDLYNKID